MVRIVFAVYAAAIAALLCGSGCRSPGDSEPSVRVFGAASLTDVLEVLADSFKADLDDEVLVHLHVAGSSLLARQVEHGAAADVIISAHPAWTTYLYERGMIQEPHELPITNRLVLVVRDSSVELRDVQRLALADPDHVPAGEYAKAALECENLWTLVSDRVAAVIDVRAALAAVYEGAADAAIVYESDSRFAPHLQVSFPFSSECRPDIIYTIGVVRDADDLAEQFAQYIMDSGRLPTWVAFGLELRNRRAER